jgi:acyl-CoA thioesterase FadM
MGRRLGPMGRIPTEPPANALRFPCELRWTDFDTYGHLHSSGHVMVLENARAKFLETVFPEDPDWILVHLSLDLVAELRQTEGYRCSCRVGVTAAGRTSLTTWEAIQAPSGAVVSRARTVVALWNPSSHSTVELSEHHRAALAAIGVAAHAAG